MTNISLSQGFPNYGYGSYNQMSKAGTEAEKLIKTPYEEEKEAKEKARLGIGEEAKKDKSSPAYECETCKNRKYQDGSNEQVSFKTPQHISPGQAMSAVMGHEQEHVANAYAKAATDNGKVISASVTIKTSICPECGRSYVAGGETRTQIKYYNEENPYQKDLALQDQSKYAGMNVDNKA